MEQAMPEKGHAKQQYMGSEHGQHTNIKLVVLVGSETKASKESIVLQAKWSKLKFRSGTSLAIPLSLSSSGNFYK